MKKRGSRRGRPAERMRRFVAVDWLALQEIAKHTQPGKGASIRSVWMAMETLAWEQRQKHHGRAFVTSLPCLAKIAEVCVATVKTASAFLEEAGLLTITRRKTSPCRLDFNHYALKYPQPIANNQLFNSYQTPADKQLVLHSKGGAKLPPAATAASPLALRGNLSPLSEIERPAAGSDGQGEPRERTAEEIEEAARAEQEQREAEAKRKAEITKRREEENRRWDERLKAERQAREKEESMRRQGDAEACLIELLNLLERRDFDPTDYAGGLLFALGFYRPEAMRWALEQLRDWDGVPFKRWQAAEAQMIADGEIPGPVLATPPPPI